MTTVNGKLIGAANPQRVEMVARLVDVTGQPAVGYVPSLEGELVQPVPIRADENGAWTAELTANALITSDAGDTLWAVQEGRTLSGTPIISYIVTPQTGGPYWVGDIRADLSDTQTGQGTVVYLAGQKGDQGEQGKPGPAGADGAAGASAYELAQEDGFEGTEAEWLASLIGPKGDIGEQGPTGPQPPLGAAGAGSTIALRSDDPTTANARTPTAHATSHATGDTDPISPASIGAYPATDGNTLNGYVTDLQNRVGGTYGLETRATALENGRLEKTQNLADLTSPATARTNLGLGGAAVLSVGTAAGTIAAGNDPRFTASVQGRNLITGRWHPEAYGAVGDYSTDDTTALQTTIDACSAAGGGTVRIGQHAVSGTGIHPRTGVTIEGVRGYSKLKQLTNNLVIASDGTACSDIAFRDFVIEGSVNEVPSMPKRTRTTSGAGTTMGIWITGDLDATATGAPTITDVTIQNVTVRNTTSLPIRISGVRGTVLTEDCHFSNTQDAGWIFCENVRVINNRSKWSADNGLSISRGNQSVVCVGNSVEGAAYHGIWLSGYIGYTGPADFTCTGNQIRSVGQTGILLQDAPKYGVVADNIIDKAYIRGDSTAPTDEYAYGIMIRGNSSTPSAPGTSIAYGLKVADNLIYRAPRAGISYDGAQSVIISGNIIQDCGTQYLADGTTVITSSYTSQNVGILCSNPSTLSAVVVRGNDIIDQRTTPYCNWGVYPLRPAGAVVTGNTMVGCRNASNLPAVLDAYSDLRLDGGQETIPRYAAASTTINMTSGALRLSYFVARRTGTCTAIRVPSGATAAGATPTLIRFVLYSVDVSGNLTQMSATTSDTTVFAAAFTSYTRTLAAAQMLVAGQLYAIGVLVVTSAAVPQVTGGNFASGAENLASPSVCAVLTGQTDIPASITAASLTATITGMYAVAVGA